MSQQNNGAYGHLISYHLELSELTIQGLACFSVFFAFVFITFPSCDSDNSTKLNIMSEICNDTHYDSNMVYIQIL